MQWQRQARHLPSGLAIVRALAADLEMQPLVALVLLLKGGVADEVLGVILLDQVVQDGARLPQCQARIRVMNCYSGHGQQSYPKLISWALEAYQ